MIIGIYNPYHKTLGGGEQYMFTFASFFLQKGHTVIYFSSNPMELKEAEGRFGFDLSKVVIQSPVFETGNLSDKIKTTRSLDILLFYSDGSVPVSFAKKTYLVFQFPVPWVNGTSPGTLIKKTRINGFIVNSEFTKQFIDKTFLVDSSVVHPAIDCSKYSYTQKEKIILSVGRFTRGMNTKRQDLMIDTFKTMVDKGFSGWKFILAGGMLDTDEEEYLKHKELAKSYPISLERNISRERLLDLYTKASIYWHASGYEVDEIHHPERVEHFGISTVEAMASGVVPIIYPAGGQKDIVENEKNGLWWKSPEDLQSLTLDLVHNNHERERLCENAVKRAKEFDTAVFFEKLQDIF